MAKLIWLGILAGLILGPGYYLYARYVSGHTTQEVVVYGVDKRGWQPGTPLPSPSWLSPLNVHLEPSMNPIAFDLIISDTVVGNEAGEHSNVYSVALEEGDRSLWAFDWKLGYRKVERDELERRRRDHRFHLVNSAYIPLYSNRLRVFSVNEPGDYIFKIEPKREGEIELHELKLVIKANVVQRNDLMMIGGFILLILSLVTGWVRLKTLSNP